MQTLLHRAPVPIIAACVFALGLAYTLQYGYGLEPCPLCLYQRIPYAAAGVLAVFALLRPERRRTALALTAAAFAAGAAIAVYHVGVEKHWWVSAVCGAPGGAAAIVTTQDLLAALSTPAPKGCDEVTAALFGVSMAAWNAAASFLLTAFAWSARNAQDAA